MALGAPDSGMSLGGDPGADMGGAPPGGDDEPADDFERAAKDALDDSLPPKERWAALKEAIHACDDDYGSSPTASGEKPKGILGIALGVPKKKD